MALRCRPMAIPTEMHDVPWRDRFAELARAAGALDLASKLAIVCILFSWFLIETLVVSWGSLQHNVRFFEISSIISDPTRMFFRIHVSLQIILFGLLCIVCLLAPLVPHYWRTRWAFLGYCAPLGLMVVCGALLYSKTSAEFLSGSNDVISLNGNFIRFANKLVHQGSDLLARHISVGVGGYTALIACIVLALQGARRYRHAAR
jgi:uncharacterized protein YggT (Ycf19 family)